MNRKDFFKKLGLGALVVAIAPKMLAQKEETLVHTKGLMPFIQRASTLSYKDTQLLSDYDWNTGMWLPYRGDLTPLEILKIWKETGHLIYRPTPHDIIRHIPITKL